MTSKDFKRVGRLLKTLYRELENRAIEEGIDITSDEYEQMRDEVRNTILTKMGYTIMEYKMAKNETVEQQKAQREKERYELAEILEEIRESIPTEEMIKELAKSVIPEPKIIEKTINKIVKEIEKPTIVQETKTIIEREEYDDSELRDTIEGIREQVQGIKMPEQVQGLTEDDVRNVFGEMFDHNINTMDMPDFRKLAMGIQAQVDENRSLITALGVPTWTTDTRPSTPKNGLVGYNYTTKELEVYDSNLGDWVQFFGYDKDDGHWEDLRFPAQSIDPVGSAAPPSRDTTDGTLNFSASLINIIAGVAQMPHAWLRGSTIRPHIHWQPTTTGSGDVLWQFEYDIASVNSNFAGTYTPLPVLDAADGVVNKHQILGFGDVTMTDKNESCIIKWRLSRVGNDDTDTYAGAAKLLEFDIHYQVGKYGTPDEYPAP